MNNQQLATELLELNRCVLEINNDLAGVTQCVITSNEKHEQLRLAVEKLLTIVELQQQEIITLKKKDSALYDICISLGNVISNAKLVGYYDTFKSIGDYKCCLKKFLLL
jgi:hypothetical protein